MIKIHAAAHVLAHSRKKSQKQALEHNPNSKCSLYQSYKTIHTQKDSSPTRLLSCSGRISHHVISLSCTATCLTLTNSVRSYINYQHRMKPYSANICYCTSGVVSSRLWRWRHWRGHRFATVTLTYKPTTTVISLPDGANIFMPTVSDTTRLKKL